MPRQSKTSGILIGCFVSMLMATAFSHSSSALTLMDSTLENTGTFHGITLGGDFVRSNLPNSTDNGDWFGLLSSKAPDQIGGTTIINMGSASTIDVGDFLIQGNVNDQLTTGEIMAILRIDLVPPAAGDTIDISLTGFHRDVASGNSLENADGFWYDIYDPISGTVLAQQRKRNDGNVNINRSVTGLGGLTEVWGRIRVNNGAGWDANGEEIHVENLKLTVTYVPVPEPATAALGLFGVAGLLVTRRRRLA